ncbi:MAG TPA: hypothetical protein VJ765_15395 [Chitinophagaceae bacterium]|nr:hypothetical protein [Chitinophagaceae bacterium]
MIINRHNYEECFILYWDNELTASQKQAVENFVKENNDLQEEFKNLGETRFTPDVTAQLEEKDFLFSNSFVNITNYEEQLLNYVDDELNNDQIKEIERAASKYPSVQKELSLLKRTKLQPEPEIVFPDKSILYHGGEKVRVISMTWFRVAVAAAIILIAGFATLRLVNTNQVGDNRSLVTVDNPKDKPSDKAEQPVTEPENQPQNNQEQTLVKADNKATQQTTGKKNKNSGDKNGDPNFAIAYEAENKNNLPKEGKNIDQPDETIVYTDFPDIKKDEIIVETNESDVVPSSFVKSDVTLKDNPTLYIPTPDDKEKGGLKEFLRKTTRVFERRTKIQTTTEDNKLLVGVFAVSLK